MPAHSDLHKAFCDNMRARRKELGLTQYDLATRLGMNRVNVTQMESGASEPVLSTLARVATALETTVADLVTIHESVTV